MRSSIQKQKKKALRRERKKFRDQIEKGTKHDAKIGNQKDRFKRRMTSTVMKGEGLIGMSPVKKTSEEKRKSTP